MKRLCKLTPVEQIESEYNEMIRNLETKENNENNKLYELKKNNNNNQDLKTFLIKPSKLLVDYTNDQLDTPPRPGIEGPWSSSDRWIGR